MALKRFTLIEVIVTISLSTIVICFLTSTLKSILVTRHLSKATSERLYKRELLRSKFHNILSHIENSSLTVGKNFLSFNFYNLEPTFQFSGFLSSKIEIKENNLVLSYTTGNKKGELILESQISNFTPKLITLPPHEEILSLHLTSPTGDRYYTFFLNKCISYHTQ